jgi:hypothetical protein
MQRAKAVKSGLLMLAAISMTAGCQQMHESADYERHRQSRISQPLAGGDFYWFDVKVTAALPLENDAAEQQRQIWLQTWLLQRKLCPAGYEILERRPFEFQEHNPAQLDIRYKVRCVVEVQE